MPAGVDLLTLCLLAFSTILALTVVVLLARVGALARRVAGRGGDARLPERIARLDRELDISVSRLEQLAGRVDRLNDQTVRCLQRVGLVRYDALKELGGHLSFTVALLDAKQDGVVLSVLNGRDGARAYAKPVAGGRSTFTLSEEEERAISQG
jgi:hypothetical protein